MTHIKLGSIFEAVVRSGSSVWCGDAAVCSWDGGWMWQKNRMGRLTGIGIFVVDDSLWIH